jgi:parallel beta-helix repeat protein
MWKLLTTVRTSAVLLAILISPGPLCAGEGKLIVRVGISAGSPRGNDPQRIQAAIDQVAKRGGGIVRVLPGRYELRTAIEMRSSVHLIGTPGQTVFVLSPGRKTSLRKDVASGSIDITVADATGFEVGMGVFLEDQSGHGFQVTTATLTQKLNDHTFRLSQPANQEYLLRRHAEVKLGFSGIQGHNIHDAVIEGITIEGNHGQPGSQYLGGCRGGGIYLAQCSNVSVRHCTVRKFNGDAISFQSQCQHITIENCLASENANVGIHPGSYSHTCIVRKNKICKNGYVGLFVCVGVRKVLFEDNVIQDNAGCGISLGFADSDNVFRGNRVLSNAETGILIRQDSAAAKDGAHRNLFENNLLCDNLGPRPARSNSRPESAGKAAVVIEGTHHGLVFRHNEFSFTKAHPGCAILCDTASDPVTLAKNRLVNIATSVVFSESKSRE